MKHIAAIVHGNDFMIILPHANLYDLEIFLRSGFDPDPSTEEGRKIYDFNDTFPKLTTSFTLQRALVEEAHQLASALKWLHEDLKIFGSYESYLAHMDLKPSNVLLVGDARLPAGKWMLSDFGVSSFDKTTNARVTDAPSIRDVGHRLTSRGFQDEIVRGHGPYQPPEVDLANVDSRKCDVWSFCCVLCDILAFAIGQTEAVHSLRNSRYDARDDYFYKTMTSTGDQKVTEINESNTQIKPEIVQWWKDLERSSTRWVKGFVEVLRQGLKPTPSRRPRIAAIVQGLNELAPSITPQESEFVIPESKTISSSPQTNGLASPPEAQERGPSITFSTDSSPQRSETRSVQDAELTDGNIGQPSSVLLSPKFALHQERDPPTEHEEDGSQSSTSNENLNNVTTHADATNGVIDIRKDPSLPSEGDPSFERPTPYESILAFQERPPFSILLPKKAAVKAVTISPSALRIAVLCKHSVHLYSALDGEKIGKHIDLSPTVEWKKIRLASRYFAVYGLLPSKEKQVSQHSILAVSPCFQSS